MLCRCITGDNMEQELVITLTRRELDIVAAGLMELQYKIAQPVLQKIDEQFRKQVEVKD